MFGKKAKELELLLTQRNHENELMRKRITDLETEVARLQEQERAVLKAITEADKTATRIVDEANADAERITTDANNTHARMIAEAKQRVCDAARQANDILAQADAEAKSIREKADDYSAKTRNDADVYSENTRTDVNIYVERSIMAAQIEVKKRKDVLAELNSLLRSTADYVSDQVLTFTDAIETSAKEAEASTADMCREIEKCSCSCKDCENPCVKADAVLEEAVEEAAPAEAVEAVEETVQEAAGAIGEAAAVAEQAVEEAAEALDEAAATFEQEVEHAVEDAVEEVEEKAAEAEEKTEEFSPAELMRRIYDIEGREIPLDRLDDEMSDRTPEGGLAFEDELGGTPFDPNAGILPADEKLSTVLSEVLEN